MKNLTNAVQKFLKDEQGLTTVEYAIAGALVAAAVVTAFSDLGIAVGDRIDTLATTVETGAAAGG